METTSNYPSRILLVELEVKEYAYLKELIRETPLRQANISLFSSFQEALGALEDSSCSLIILSTRVGQERLFRLLDELFIHSIHVPIIIFGYSRDNEDLRLEALEKGVQDILIKEELTPQQLHRAFSFATARNLQQESLREQSMTDELTKLLNRRGFLHFGNKMLSYAKRHSLKLSLMMIDLDGFKKINDLYGHPVGDEALKELAMCLKEATREHDLTARLGGDEFVIFVIHQNGDPSGRIYAHLMDKVQKVNEKHQGQYNLSLSCGQVLFDPQITQTLEEMLSEADKSLYAVKKK